MDNFREEVAVKHNRTMSNILYALSWLALILCGFIALMNFSYITSGHLEWLNIVLMLVFGGLAFLIWRSKDNLRIEYDYTFTNGDLDVGKVFGNSRRRLMTSLAMKNVEACGAVTHQSFQRYMTMSDCKKHNWFVNRDAHLYYFYFVKNEVKHCIILELSEEMVAMLRPYLPFSAWQG